MARVAAAVDPDDWARYAQALGLSLQRARHERKLTQEVLAHRAGLTKTHYQQMEWGRWGRGKPANPSIKVLVALARELEVEVAALLPPMSALQDGSTH